MGIKIELTPDENIILEIDPTDSFSAGGDLILNSIGILPVWSCVILRSQCDPVKKIKELYDFGVYEIKGGIVDVETGDFKYPEDPVQNPLVKISNIKTGKRIFIYNSAVVAIETESGFFVTRLD